MTRNPKNLKAGDKVLVKNTELHYNKLKAGCSYLTVKDATEEAGVAYLVLRDDKHNHTVKIKISEYLKTWFLEDPDNWSSRK